MDNFSVYQGWSYYYELHLNVCFVMATVVYPYFVFLVYTKSPSSISSTLKFGFINCSVSGYLLNTWYFVCRPMPWFYLGLSIFHSPLFPVDCPLFVFLLLSTVTVLIVNIYNMYLYMLLYYYSIIKPNGFFYQHIFRHSLKKQILIYVVGSLGMLIIIFAFFYFMFVKPTSMKMKNQPTTIEIFPPYPGIIPFSLLNPNNISNNEAALTFKLKATEIIYEEFDPFSPEMLMFTALMITLNLMLSSLLSYMIYKIHIQLERTKLSVQLQTRKHQLQLFNLFKIKTFFLVVFFGIPYLLITLSFSGFLPFYGIQLLIHSIFVVHAPLVYVFKIFLIPTFRAFTLNILNPYYLYFNYHRGNKVGSRIPSLTNPELLAYYTKEVVENNKF